jgi:phosphoserine phosphatase
MTFAPLVATLISASGEASITDALLEAARQALARAGAEAVDMRVLRPGGAVDLLFLGPDAEGATRAFRDSVHERLSGERIDIVVQPRAFRRKRLLVADMDSTMIQQECIDELADFVGLREQVAEITERAMRGDVAFEPALRERVALLRGLDESVIARAIADRISFTPGARVLVQTMRAHGAMTALVSGGFTAFTGPLAEALGFQEHRSNRLVVEQGRLAGRVHEPILGRQAKLEALRDLRDRQGLAPQETLAIGDGANDLGMIEEAGLGVAFHAKPAVAAVASARLDHADLTGVLFIQGYEEAEFVRD